MKNDLLIGATLARKGQDGEPIECDMVLYFSIASHTKGCPARIRYDENDHPADPEEFEFQLDRIEFDGPHDDAPGDLTETERETLTAWFEAHHDAACERASEYVAQRDRDDADEWFDRRCDARLMERVA